MHDAMKAYHESWERELDRQFLKNDRYRKRAYICSPLSGSTAEEELSNIWRARAYMLYARTMLGYMARAPHAYLPMLLCDHVAAERALALQFGLQLLEQSEVLLICGGRISRGMKGEIHHAAQLGMTAATLKCWIWPTPPPSTSPRAANISLSSSTCSAPMRSCWCVRLFIRQLHAQRSAC